MIHLFFCFLCAKIQKRIDSDEKNPFFSQEKSQKPACARKQSDGSLPQAVSVGRNGCVNAVCIA